MIRDFFKRKYVFAIFYSIFLICFSLYIVLEATVIEKGKEEVEHNEVYENDEKGTVISEENLYQDDNIKIEISYDRYCDSDVYIAEVTISDSKYFKTAFASDMYGRNIIDTVSSMADANNVIFAVNGDYYGARDYGYVYRNGVLYRDSARPDGKDAALIYYTDGSISMVNERLTTVADELKKAQDESKEIKHIFSFGPALVIDNEIIYSYEEKDLYGNPRTAFGILEPLHYIFVCIDGRTDENAGVTIEELANYMRDLGCENAYNLDGGSSTTMYFNGQVINSPSNGSERPVSDIVYIGY